MIEGEHDMTLEKLSKMMVNLVMMVARKWWKNIHWCTLDRIENIRQASETLTTSQGLTDDRFAIVDTERRNMKNIFRRYAIERIAIVLELFRYTLMVIVVATNLSEHDDKQTVR